MITDDTRYDGGLLIDWDLCKAKEIQSYPDPRPSRTVCGVIPGLCKCTLS